MLAKDIAERTGVPGPYLSKIMHALGKANLIRTKRGYKGGFVLTRPAREIAVLDVVQAVDGESALGGCLLGLTACADDRACPAHAFWKVQRAKIQARLAKLSLRDIATFERHRITPYAHSTRTAETSRSRSRKPAPVKRR
jgi:Rrf2 family protein